MRARLTKILRERGLKNFSEYYEKVVADSSGAELTCLLDDISTNQTAFWREPKHFQYLADEVLPAWPPERRHPLRGKLSSAGCSSGEEPYTLAIMVMTAFPRGGPLPGQDLCLRPQHPGLDPG